VNHGSNWDVAKRQVVTWLDIRGWSIFNLCTLLNSNWRDDVTLLAICKVN
jgi:hypothetical protein